MKAPLLGPLGLATLAALLACRAAPSQVEGAPRPAVLAPKGAPETVTGPPQGRPSVPPGVLSRAAAAKALERGPRCPVVRPPDPAACAPSPRDDLEIEWDGAPEP